MAPPGRRGRLPDAVVLLVALVAGCTPVVVDVDGEPGLRVWPGELDLGTVFVGDYARGDLRVENPAAVDQELDWTIEGEGAAAFGARAGVATVPAGGSVTLTVLFTPTAWGRFDGALVVRGGDVDVTLSGDAQDDGDGDGHGSLESGGDDCDDADARVTPGAAETWYDGVDQDCDGNDDDQDGDGAPVAEDCDDADPAVTVAVAETLNGVDDDCDGLVDDVDVGSAAAGVLYGESPGGALGGGGTFAFAADVDDDGRGDLVALERSDWGTAWIVDGAQALGWQGPVEDAASAQVWGTGRPVFAGLAPPADVTGDGLADLVAGAWDEGDALGWAVLVPGDEGLAGGVGVYSHASAWFSGDSDGDMLGPTTLADVDGDGLADVLAGSPLDSRVYDRDDDRETIFETGNLTAFRAAALEPWMTLDEGVQVHGGERSSWLGTQLAAADVDGDGFADVLVSAPGHDTGAEGVVYLLPGSADLDWGSTAAASAAVTFVGDVDDEALGDDPMHPPRDLDGDGAVDVVLGSGATGRVAVFLGAAGLSGQVAMGEADVLLAGEGGFGEALGTADLDGDGLPTLLVGAPGDDRGGQDAGAVLLFVGLAGEPAATLLGHAAGDRLGDGLSRGLDLDGDGDDAIAVGAPGSDEEAEDGGAIWLLE